MITFTKEHRSKSRRKNQIFFLAVGSQKQIKKLLKEQEVIENKDATKIEKNVLTN